MKGRAQRGHVLAEVMVSGVIVAWALMGIAAGVRQGTAQLAVGLKEQQLAALAQQKVEQLTQALSGTWPVAATPTPESDVGGNIGWTRTTVYSAVLFDPDSSGIAAPTPEITATVTVASPDGTSATRTITKWVASY